ncbi:MAG TPA: hypothetical protein VGJ25_11540 [Gaiellaceae bacterium]|jgi:hypothetical protein
MSDFLARIAARAVGEAPVARPRLPALYEEPEAGAAEVGLELVDEEVAAPAGPAPVHGDAAGGTNRGATAVPPPEAPGPPAPSGHPEPPAVAPPAQPPHVASAPPMLGSERDRLEPELVSAVASEHEAPERSSAAVPAREAIAVPATPAVPDSGPPVGVPAEAAAVANDEPPAVRVHIGRLEVRANLHEAPVQQRPRRDDAPPQGLSLADYLRGRRELG